jgi:ATP-dependent RNA helicase DDX21
MASIIGVSSIYHQTPCELYKRAAAPITTTTATSSSGSSSSPCVSLAFPERQRAHFNSVLRARSVFATQAIATPNSVLSEEAFKGLGDFSKDSLDSESEYDSETEAAEPANEDELALSKLGLPRRLVDTLERRGISSLFPIQVVLSLSVV